MGNVTTGLSLDARRFSRRLRRSPWFALTTAVMLGGVFAIVGVTFALADGVLFKALPFRAAEELYIVQPAGSHASEPKSLPVRGDVVAAWFSDVHDAALTAINVAPRLFVKAEGRDYFMAGIDEHFFDVIGVSPMMGGFTSEDFDSTNPAALPPAVISYRLWRSMFGQDENILGRSVVLLETKNRQAGVRIAGVLGPDFVFPSEPDEASPDVLTPLSRRAIAGSKRPTFRVIARLAPEVSVAGVGEQLRRAMIDAELVLKSSNEPRLDRLTLEPLQQHLGSNVRGVVTFIVLGAILLMLLLCGNLAALASARELARTDERATERALGAGCWLLVRGTLLELCTMVTGGVVIAVVLMPVVLQWTTGTLPPHIALLKVPAIDGRVAAVIATISVLAFGAMAVIPLTRAVSSRPSNAVGFRALWRYERWVLLGQAAVSVTLVAGGVLSGASYLRAWTKGATLDRTSIATFELLATKILDPLDAKRRIELAVDTLVRTHNDTTVAVADLGIFSPVRQVQSVIVPFGFDGPLEGVDVRLVTREFFDIMRVPLTEGRWPAATDWQEEAAVAIITETAAEVMWPGHTAVGKTLVPLRASQQTITRPVTVIAVVADQRYGALDAQTTGTIFLPNPLRLNSVGAVLIAKTPGPANGFLETMRASLSGVDGVRVTRSATLGDVLFDSIRHRAFPAWLFGWFGIVAFAILASGIMGTVSMSVARYRPEIGVRLALGASPQRIVWRLVRDRLVIILCGCFVGWLLSLWLAKYVDVHLYGISSVQASVWMSIAIGAGIVTGVAAIVPARRVFRIDPASLLRELR